MTRLLSIPIIMLFMILFQGLAYSQDIPATTENGRKVILKANGTWEYADATKPTSSTGSYVKSEKATTVFDAKGGKISVWFDPAKWTMKKSDEPNRTYFSYNDGDLYAIMIAERIGMSIEGLKEMAIRNAKAAAPDIKVTSEQDRVVNGKDILCMKLEGTIEGVQFVYYSYYYAGKAGTVQLLTYTSQNLFSEFEPEMTEFLNGLVIND